MEGILGLFHGVDGIAQRCVWRKVKRNGYRGELTLVIDRKLRNGLLHVGERGQRHLATHRGLYVNMLQIARGDAAILD